MIKRTVEISSGPVHLSIKYNQMQIRKNGDTHSVPVEDLGILVLSHPAISYTHQLMYELLENNVAVLFCNRQHMPAGLLLPFEDNQLHQARLKLQIDATKPTKKRLWQQVVRAKIKAQADLIESIHGDHKGLIPLIKKVQSGDLTNQEARAARLYWKHLFPDEFRRDFKATDVNALLNYGYAIIRAVVARSITAAGLHPSIGIHHSNQYNPYCLADDMMEPFRPMVDGIAYKFTQQNKTLSIPVEKETKKPFLELLTYPVRIREKRYPFLESLHLMASSLVDGLSGIDTKLAIPTYKPTAA